MLETDHKLRWDGDEFSKKQLAVASMLECQVDFPTMAEEEESFRLELLDDGVDTVQLYLPTVVAIEMKELLEAGNS